MQNTQPQAQCPEPQFINLGPVPIKVNEATKTVSIPTEEYFVMLSTMLGIEVSTPDGNNKSADNKSAEGIYCERLEELARACQYKLSVINLPHEMEGAAEITIQAIARITTWYKLALMRRNH